MFSEGVSSQQQLACTVSVVDGAVGMHASRREPGGTMCSFVPCSCWLSCEGVADKLPLGRVWSCVPALSACPLAGKLRTQRLGMLRLNS